MKTPLRLLLFVIIGLSIYFIFLGDEILTGAALLMLAGGLDFILMHLKRKWSK